MPLDKMPNSEDFILTHNSKVLHSKGKPFACIIAEAIKVARKSKKSESIVVTLSGRGDKDIEEVQNYLREHDKN